MPAYIPPHLRRAQHSDDGHIPLPRSQGQTPRSPPSARPAPPSGADSTSDSTPVWRRGATASSGPVATAVARPSFLARRPSGPRLTYASTASSNAGRSSPFAATTSAAPAPRVQTVDEKYRYNTYARTSLLLQPRPIKAEQCEEHKEYAQWAGGYVEINDKLFSVICPCNLVGKPCIFDELADGCPMIRLCAQLEKWTVHKCPDKGFRTILDAAENVPSDYGDKGFGVVNFYNSSDNESGGVALESSTNSETTSSDDNANENESGGVALESSTNSETTSSDDNANENATDLQPSYHGKKVSFNDFSCGVKNDCGHIHWEVEINCRFVGWSHYKDIPCKQVLEKFRLCSCGHDLESSRRAARDAVKDHERAAVRAGAPQPQELGKRWVY